MADMELVIKIAEVEYEHLTNKEKFNSLEKSKQEWLINKTLNCVINGTPLPKGHGRLIDADELKKIYDERISRLYALNKKDNPLRESKICATNWCNNTVNEAPTIIETDEESEDKE